MKDIKTKKTSKDDYPPKEVDPNPKKIDSYEVIVRVCAERNIATSIKGQNVFLHRYGEKIGKINKKLIGSPTNDKDLSDLLYIANRLQLVLTIIPLVITEEEFQKIYSAFQKRGLCCERIPMTRVFTIYNAGQVIAHIIEDEIIYDDVTRPELWAIQEASKELDMGVRKKWKDS